MHSSKGYTNSNSALALSWYLMHILTTTFSMSGVNQMWILTNSKELLEILKSRSLSSVTSIKSYDFSTLYTTIPHAKLKSRFKQIIYNSFFCKKNGRRRYKYIVINNSRCYFVINHSDAKQKYTEDDIVNMLDFLIDNIYVEFGGQIFQQVVGIPMGTNCAPLLADLFLYSYEAEFIENLKKSSKKNLARSFNFTFRYIDDVLSLNNPKFSDYVDFIYPEDLEIKDTTDSPTHASYLDILLSYDQNQHLTTKIYDKRDDFDFSIVNFPFLSSNIPESPAYGVYISQLIRYSRACSDYDNFINRSLVLTLKLLRQGYKQHKLRNALKKFYGRHHELIEKYHVSVSKILIDLSL